MTAGRRNFEDSEDSEEASPGGPPTGELVKFLDREGDGVYPQRGQTVFIHYTSYLYLENGTTKLDSSKEKGRPFAFVLGAGHVIQGLDAAVTTMSRGEEATFIISHKLAYGDTGLFPHYPPKANLYYIVELLDIQL